MSRAISTNKDEIPRWNFKNSLKLNLKKLDKPVSHQVIFELLDQVLSRFQRNQIAVAQTHRNAYLQGLYMITPLSSN